MNEIVPTADETPEMLAQREARRRAAEIAAANNSESGIGKFISGLIDFFRKFFGAVFGGFLDSESEYSEISREQAKPSGWGERGKERATSFIASLGNERLSALAEEYRGKELKNISPFAVTAEISSNLGKRPVKVGSTDHKGIDLIPAESGNGRVTIHNTMPGVVIRSETQYNKDGKMDGFGHWVEVACIDGTRRRYAHLAEKGVAVGTVLRQGDLIGVMGATGVGTGAHLHYEWRDANGKVLVPEINGTRYGRDDRSYISSKVEPSVEASRSFAALVDPASQPKLPTQNGGNPKPLAMKVSKTAIGGHSHDGHSH